ncbi:hypothetical protein [Kutzneria sp. CA-103260]|uniref:hypothetical protein n=1 Tax=Kutzneria sp. CA-103260 TaxID=2802641 RepID=UPI001BA981E1|nr:hypothetical protein [Kutzneria sp. CA-103260]
MAKRWWALAVLIGCAIGAGTSANAAPTPAADNVPASAQPADNPPTPVHYRVDTTTRVAKLGSDLVIGPGRLDGQFVIVPGSNPLRVEITGALTLPPADSYFVTFGFMPATATITVVSTAPVQSVLLNGTLTATIHATFGLTSAKVHGVPLNMGPNCRSDEAVIVQSGPFLSPLSTGTISGTFTIPPFHHCGVTENLDPLFTGLVSGPGNTLRTVLTFLCGGTATCEAAR